MSGFSIEKISDRKSLKGETRLRKAGLRPYMMDRLDMFSIHYTSPEGRSYTWFVDPSLTRPGEFSLSYQDYYSQGRPPKHITELAEEYFRNSQAYDTMGSWVSDLKEEYIGWPGTSEWCPVCGFSFEEGTQHKHSIGNEYHPFLPYQGKEEERRTKEILGEEESHGSYFYTKEPSLEDVGFSKELLSSKKTGVAKLIKLGLEPKKVKDILGDTGE